MDLPPLSAAADRGSSGRFFPCAFTVVYGVQGQNLFEAPLPILLPVLLSAVLFCEASLRGLITRSTVASSALAALLFVAAGMALFGNWDNGILLDEEFCLTVAVSALVVAPIAWMPLSVQWQRHR